MPGLTKEQLAKRRFSIGASDAGAIVAGGERMWRLWAEKIGDTEPEDLSGVLPVQMGIATEDLNRRWFSRTTGIEVSLVGLECAHREYGFMTCTLDGWVMVDGMPIPLECKHVGGRETIDVVAQRYMPQLHHQMAVTGTARAMLSVLIGTDRYDLMEIPRDEFYLADLIERETQFWCWVQDRTAPPDMSEIVAPVPPENWRTVDFTGHNEFADHAATWLETKAPAKRFETATKGLKALVQADVGKAMGHGVCVSRSKAGALTVKEIRA